MDSPEAKAGGFDGQTITAQPTASAPLQVWLVDDNEEFRGLMANVLDRQKDLRCVRQFSSPDQVLSALASQAGPDIILMDVHMGDRNGLDAIGPIKALARDTQVLMLTSFFDDLGKTRALEEGASDFLLKTYAPDEIVARIRNPHRKVNARRRRVVKPACPGKSDRLNTVVLPHSQSHEVSRGGNRAESQPSLVKGGLRFLRKLLGERRS